ncbi:hypothetical protein QR680_009847 [Steinernema hermaphroditum]|uniref:Eukaryotic translation initiation factor 3 subunit H n=1 Tax=Steinernema hermaphroditum TaxID=289476 RepID=A0AA39IN47_9BILA|nr:hypothetical protein QR680_009847 [Steinernema hermaphroditum]
MTSNGPLASSISSSRVDFVQLDSLVVMKIVKHVDSELYSGMSEVAGETCQGCLTGLVAVDDKRLEITNCFASPRSEVVLDSEEAGGVSVQNEDVNMGMLEMLRRFRNMNIDYELVGFYQAHPFGACFAQEVVESLFEYQRSFQDGVVLIYDPLRTRQGHLSIKAYRLSDKGLRLCEKSDWSPEATKTAGLSFEDLFQELPIVIKNSHLINVMLAELAMKPKQGAGQIGRHLTLTSRGSMEKCLRALMSDVDDLVKSINTFNKYSVDKQKNDVNYHTLVQKRHVENEARAARGEAPLSLDDIKKMCKPPTFVAKNGMLEPFLACSQTAAHADYASQVTSENIAKIFITETAAARGTPSRDQICLFDSRLIWKSLSAATVFTKLFFCAEAQKPFSLTDMSRFAKETLFALSSAVSMKLLLTVCSFAVLTASTFVPVIREDLFNVDCFLSVNFRSRSNYIESNCRDFSVMVDSLFRVDILATERETKIIRNGHPYNGTIETISGEAGITITMNVTRAFVKVSINDHFTQLFPTKERIRFVEIQRKHYCTEDTIYEKHLSEIVYGFTSPHQRQNENQRKQNFSVQNLQLKEVYLLKVHRDPDPYFFYVTAFAFVICVVALLPLGVSLYYDHLLLWKWHSMKHDAWQPNLTRADLEVKFPDEVARFKGLVPQVHVAGMTQVQAAHVTYIGPEERKKLLDQEDDTQTTRTQSKASLIKDSKGDTLDGKHKSKASRKGTEEEIIPVNDDDVNISTNLHQAANDAKVADHMKDLAKRLAEKKKKKLEEKKETNKNGEEGGDTEQKIKEEEKKAKKKSSDEEQKDLVQATNATNADGSCTAKELEKDLTGTRRFDDEENKKSEAKNNENVTKLEKEDKK